jgi:hypothetical protein
LWHVTLNNHPVAEILNISPSGPGLATVSRTCHVGRGRVGLLCIWRARWVVSYSGITRRYLEQLRSQCNEAAPSSSLAREPRQGSVVSEQADLLYSGCYRRPSRRYRIACIAVTDVRHLTDTAVTFSDQRAMPRQSLEQISTSMTVVVPPGKRVEPPRGCVPVVKDAVCITGRPRGSKKGREKRDTVCQQDVCFSWTAAWGIRGLHPGISRGMPDPVCLTHSIAAIPAS